MNQVTGQEFIYGMSAVGAGIAMIAGIGPGIGQGIAAGYGSFCSRSQSRVLSQISLQPCFLDRPLPRQQVFTDLAVAIILMFVKPFK